MKSNTFPIAILVAAFTVSAAIGDESVTLKFPGGDGPGKGKKIVLVAGDEEYRSEESMPMLAKLLSHRHGFDCEVVFSWDADGKYLDPNNQAGLRGLAALDDADLMIIATRFRAPSEEEAAHITAFLNAGKPVIGLRTATHAFNGKGRFGDSLDYGKFGLEILGEQWVSHHGAHKKQGCRAVVEGANANNAILSGVKDVFVPTDVYGVVHLTDKDAILLRGAVTETLDPASKAIDGEKNEPMQPLAWLHLYTAPNGTTQGHSFCTTMGASVDLVNEDLRRLVVNAAFQLTGLEVPEKADVAFVDPFYPSFYGFIKEPDHWKKADLQPSDFALGQAPSLPDPAGSPEWNFRPRKP
ncbi:MAG: ThuA domain-containing protein [Akkermansiaceae bacterium]|nr:ThuA domain-containing protein [Akkermansiaceae bacterium]